MSSLLEKYLRDVAVQLHELPDEEREDQVEEIRAHLTAYAEKRRAAGAGEEEAIKAAITQFGRPADVGQRIARTRMRGMAYLAALVATALLAVAGAAGINGGLGPGLVTRSLSGILISALATVLQMLLIGCFFGTLLRKPAIKLIAIFYTLTATFSIIGMVSGYQYVAHEHLTYIHASNLWPTLGMNMLSMSFRVVFATVGAWIGAKMADKLTRRHSVAAR